MILLMISKKRTLIETRIIIKRIRILMVIDRIRARISSYGK
jgi:hypothetical protein